MPTKVYTAESEVDAAALNDCIEKIDIPGAITVYKALVANKTDIPDDVKQSLLELVTFYNGVNPLPEDSFEERDYLLTVARQQDYEPPKWKNGGFAEQLYDSIEPKTTAAYNTMIRGLVKFNQSQKANALFEEVIGKDVPIDTATYNAIIVSQSKIVSDPEQRWNAVVRLLQHMNERHVTPNVHTMNAILENIKYGGAYSEQRQKVLNVLAEFKALNIEPSLGTWYNVLKIFCRERCPTSHILGDILNHLGDSELKYQHQIDMMFFMAAMGVCSNHVQDFELAKRVDRLLNNGQNYQLIGDSNAQRVYYRCYLQLAVKALPLAEFIELYDDIVPNLYSLDITLCGIIVGKINESGSIEFIPKFWSDMLIGDLITHRCSKTLEQYLNVMCDNPPQHDVPAHVNLDERFGECAWVYWQRLSNEVARDRCQSIMASTMGKLLLLCCRHKKFERTAEIMDAILVGTRKNLVTGVVPYAQLKTFVEFCVAEKQPTLAVNVLGYAVERCLEESVHLGKMISEQFTLNERDMRRVSSLVGRI